MAYQQFVLSDNNPNDVVGGGGCMCDPRKLLDSKGPYVVVRGNQMAHPKSPHVVVCAGCVCKLAETLEGEALTIGSKPTVPQGHTDPRPTKARRKPPVVESPDPKHDFDDIDI